MYRKQLRHGFLGKGGGGRENRKGGRKERAGETVERGEKHETFLS